jgi:histidinol-phosphate aminotransferase
MNIEASILESLRAIASYPTGKPIAAVAREFGLDPAQITKLASNENALGMSPLARAALRDCSEDLSRYPDSDCHELRQALASHLGQPAEHIMPGAGSSQLILLAVRAFLDATRAAVIPQYSFVSYKAAVRSVGARSIVVPLRGWQHDLDRLLAAIDDSVRLMFIATPNNPTGAMIDAQQLARFIAAVPGHVLVVLDEAYRDFVPPANRPEIEPLLDRHRNLLVLRTFSKIYGLAGLRIGYAIGDPQVIDVLRCLQLPFSLNTHAQVAALAALGDTTFVERSFQSNLEQRAWLCAQLAAIGLPFLPSAGNFVLIHVGDGASVYQALLRRGVIVRRVANYGLPQWLRVTVGLPQENRLLVEHLRAIMSASTAVPAGMQP